MTPQKEDKSDYSEAPTDGTQTDPALPHKKGDLQGMPSGGKNDTDTKSSSGEKHPNVTINARNIKMRGDVNVTVTFCKSDHTSSGAETTSGDKDPTAAEKKRNDETMSKVPALGEWDNVALW